MARLTPEDPAREKIDDLLATAGWISRDYTVLNLAAGRRIALREIPLKSGRCNYQRVADRVPAGIIVIRKPSLTFSAVADQSGHYPENLPDFLADLTPGKLHHPLLYECTGAGRTFLACGLACRLIRHANARRNLFLVVRSNLGSQAILKTALNEELAAI